jgi:hypothetical protein
VRVEILRSDKGDGMKLSFRFLVLTSILVLASLAAATAATAPQGAHPRTLIPTQTISCFVQCIPGGNSFIDGMTIEECCSYVSGNCYGTGYSFGGDAIACSGE